MVLTQQTVHRNWLFALIVTLLLLPMSVVAEVPSGEEILQELLRSFRAVDFEGRLTFAARVQEGNPMGEALVIRKAPDKQRIEFVWPPEMRGMGMLISGEERWPIRGERSRRGRPFLSLPPNRMMEEFPLKNIQLLLKNYDVQVLDGGHVAGRSTYLLEIEPRVTGKPSRKIWVDAEMGVMLKMEHYDHRKRLGQVFAYSEIDFKPEIDESAFQREHRVEDRERPPKERGREELWNYNQGELDLEKIRAEGQLNVILPDREPAGFTLQSVHALRIGERKNVHLMYTDGLAMLSVFQSLSDGGMRGARRGARREDRPPWRGGKVEKMDVDGIECEVISRGGPMLIFRWSHRGIYFTLMGELGQKEMMEAVSSFVRKESDVK